MFFIHTLRSAISVLCNNCRSFVNTMISAKMKKRSEKNNGPRRNMQGLKIAVGDSRFGFGLVRLVDQKIVVGISN